jgi:hypothetical protein
MRKRDYKLEYNLRLLRAFTKGHSRSQARGHARAGERPIRAPPAQAVGDARLEAALKQLRRTQSQSRAAAEAGVSTERFRRFVRENELAKREGRKWVFSDQRSREMSALTTTGSRVLKVAGFDLTSLIGRHNAAVNTFLQTNDAELLAPFKGLSVKDIKGRTHFLETRPNTIHRLANSEPEAFEMVYRLTQ